MKLPDIEYDRSMVQESSGALARVGEAQRRAFDTFSAGLYALNQEMVRTQTAKAAADFEAGMAEDEADLASKRYLTVEAVRAELGPAWDSLPEGIRSHRQTVDDEQGGQVEVVPTYLVAGALFDKRSQARIEQASKGISGAGWQTAFKESAGQDLAKRRARIALQQARAAEADFREIQIATADQYVRAGAWDRALATIDQSRALSEGEKATRREDVLAKKQHAEAVAVKVQQAAAVEGRSAEILQGARIPGYDWIDSAKALAAVEALPADDPAKDEIRRLVEHQVMKSEQLRERAGKDMLNRAQSMLAQGVLLTGSQMAPIREWLLDPQNGGAGEWRVLEQMVATEERTARIERNDRRAAKERDAREARREESDRARDEREQAQKDKALQAERDQEALNDFDDLDPKEQAETDLRAKYPDVDPKGKAFAKLADRKRKAATALAKDQGVNVGEFKAKVDATALKLGYSKKDTAAFRTQMLDGYLSRADPTKPVLPAEADAMLAEAVVYADVSMGRDVPAWKLRMHGKDAKPAADQPERVRAVIAEKTAPAEAPTVLVQYGEKRLRIPRTRLAEAIKDGATEVQ